MKLLDRFRQLSLVGSGLFWSAYASADLPKLSGARPAGLPGNGEYGQFSRPAR